MTDLLSDAEHKMNIIHDVLIEVKDELTDGWYDEALQTLQGKKKRKIVPPEEYYGELPVYETDENYER